MRRDIFVPLRDAQQDQPVSHCENPKCKGEIWREEATFMWENKEICSNCFKDLIEFLMREDLVGLACMMNVDVQRYV